MLNYNFLWQAAENKVMCESSQTLRCCACQNGNKNYNASLICLSMDPNITWDTLVIHSFGCGPWTQFLTLFCNYFILLPCMTGPLGYKHRCKWERRKHAGYTVAYRFLALSICALTFFVHTTWVLRSSFGESFNMLNFFRRIGNRACALTSPW